MGVTSFSLFPFLPTTPLSSPATSPLPCTCSGWLSGWSRASSCSSSCQEGTSDPHPLPLLYHFHMVVLRVTSIGGQLGLGVNRLRDLIQHLGYGSWARVDEVVRYEYRDSRVPSSSLWSLFLVVLASMVTDGPLGWQKIPLNLQLVL